MKTFAYLPVHACLALVLAATAPAATVQECLATPAECGLPPLQFSQSPTAPEPQEAREWQRAEASPITASLQGVLDYGTKQACAVLRDAEGCRQLLPLEDMLPGDRLMVEKWVKGHGFIELPLQQGGSLCARVEELADCRVDRPFPFYEIRLLTPDGRPLLLCCNARPVSEAEARRVRRAQVQGRSVACFTAEGLELLRKAAAAPKPETTAAPVLMAASPAEARAYAELHGIGVVTLYLNQRGSECDLAWKRYLHEHPEAGAHWNNKYVFVGVYCDERGNYPAELLQEIQASVRYGTADRQPPSALNVGSAYKGVPRFHSLPMPNNCYTIADFLRTPPDQVTFGPCI